MKNNRTFLEKLLDGAEVEWKTLDEISSIYGGLTGKGKADFENGNALYVPYKNIFNNIEVDFNNLEAVNVSDDERQYTIKYGDVLFTGSSETAEEAGMSSAVTTKTEQKIYLNSFSFGLRFNDDVELLPEFSKFLFRTLSIRKEIVKSASGVTRFNISKARFKKIKIPIPPLSVQTEIVKILDTLTALTSELTSELTLRRKQYEYYREKLLSEEELGKVGVQWKALGEIVPISRGKRLIRSQLKDNDQYPVYQNSLQPLGYYDHKNCRAYMTFVIAAGAAGEIGFSNVEFWAADDCYYFDCANKILHDKFLYYFLLSNKHLLTNQVRKASVPRLSRVSIEKIKIPIVSFKEQERIVAILDKFETLTHSISEGLPLAIGQSRKRYEYYRELLLNFS